MRKIDILIRAVLLAFLIIPNVLWSQMEVTNAPPITPENLITNIFLGDGVEVIDVTYQGAATAVGFFNHAEDIIGIERGIIMTSGRAVSQGANFGAEATGGDFASNFAGGNVNDVDADAIASPFDAQDVAKYTITFVPISDTLRFKYVWASEEYPEYACSDFNDVFGFFISGPGISGPYENDGENIAFVPGTTLPVTINNVNAGVVGAAGNIANCTPPNGSLAYSEFYVDNNGTGNQPVYDGFTTVLTAEAVVIPCETYTIKLVIADASDSAFDSGVFLEAKSFGTGSLDIEVTTVSLDGSVAEGCEDGTLTFALPNPVESDYYFDYTILGDAINGVDYEFIPSDLFIPAGDSSITVPIIAFEDGLVEGDEYLLLDIQRDPCTRDTISIIIRDNPLVDPDLGDDIVMCEGDSIQLDGTLDVPLPDPPSFTNDNTLLVPSHNIPTFSEINVQNVIPLNLSAGVIASVCIDSLEHRWIDDMDLYLISPDGQFLELTTDNGGNGGNGLGLDYMIGTCFTVDATDLISAPGPFAPPEAVPFTGNYLPEGVWSDLWDGGNRATNGIWTLQLLDDTQGLDGTLFSWTITFNPVYNIEYSWSPADGLSCTDCPDPIASPTTTTTYTMTATDTYGCTVMDEITIEVEPALEQPVLSCGVITSNSITFIWNDVPGAIDYLVNVNGTGWITPSDAFSHTVTGLTFLETVTLELQAIGNTCPSIVTSVECITPNCDPAIAEAITTPTSCPQGDDGMVQINITAGMGPFSFDLDGEVNNTGLFTGLTPDTYSVLVTDGVGCTGSLGFMIEEANAPNVTAMVLGDISCSGFADGQATVDIVNGNGPYSFDWSSGSTDSIATNLSVGPQTLFLTDDAGCTTEHSFDLAEPDILTATTDSIDVACFGDATGVAAVLALGGTGAYNYIWDANANDQTGDVATNLTTGTYSVTVTDDNNCEVVAIAEVLDHPLIELQTTSDSTNCLGSADGSATVMVNGGVSDYTYEWFAVNNSTIVATDATASALTGGDYLVEVTDALGCLDTAYIEVLSPDIISFQVESTPVQCFGGDDGIISINVTGGTSPYQYAWSDGGDPADVRNDLMEGSYTITITDGNDCELEITSLVETPTPIEAQFTLTDPNCFEGADGNITSIVNGGIPIYSYEWSDGQMVPDPVDLPAGMAMVTITDANSCEYLDTLILVDPVEMTLSLSGDDPSCFGESSGSAMATASGGTGQLSYAWSNGPSTPDNNDIPLGNYQVTVTDENNCSVESAIELTQPTELTTVINSTLVGCFGVDDGTATVSPSGGTTPYSYSWSDSQGQQTQVASALPVGSYTVTITDAQGCEITESVDIGSVSLMSVSYTSTNISCHDGGDGNINVAVSGGGGSYNYSWSEAGMPNSANVSGLSSGSYDVTITDALGCSEFLSISLSQPSALVVSGNEQDVSCNNFTDGEIQVNVSGGIADYNYLWSNGTTGLHASDLSNGSYSISVTDANGCLTVEDFQIEAPESIRIDFDATDIDCYGESTGFATSQVVGGVPGYSYAWSNGINGAAIGNVSSGFYTLEIIDNNGCIEIDSVYIGQPAAPLTADIGVEDISCFDGRDGLISAATSGGTPPYSYSLDNETFNGSPSQIGLEAGTYNLFIVDGNGCTYFESNINIVEPDPLEVDLGPDQTITFGETVTLDPQFSGSSTPVIFTWWPRDSSLLSCLDCPNPIVTTDHQVSIQLEVTDENGCIDDDIITIHIAKDFEIVVPSGFTPNDDGTNDLLVVHGKPGIEINFFRVYDRWGELLFEDSGFSTNDATRGWDGMYRGEFMNTGIYIWHLEATLPDGSLTTYSGSTTLVR
jgi:gliding motility-associated-like protein